MGRPQQDRAHTTGESRPLVVMGWCILGVAFLLVGGPGMGFGQFRPGAFVFSWSIGVDGRGPERPGGRVSRVG